MVPPKRAAIGSKRKEKREASDPSTSQARLVKLSLSQANVASNPNTPFETLLSLVSEHPMLVLNNSALPLLSIEEPAKYQELIEAIEMQLAKEVVVHFAHSHFYHPGMMRDFEQEVRAIPSRAHEETIIQAYNHPGVVKRLLLARSPVNRKLELWISNGPSTGFCLGTIENGQVKRTEPFRPLVYSKSPSSMKKKEDSVGAFFTTIQTERSTFDVWKNPSFYELDRELKLKKGRPVRGLVIGNDVYFWDSHSATHSHVLDYLNLPRRDTVQIELVPTNAGTGFFGELPPRQPTYEGFSIEVDYPRGWPPVQWETHPYFAERPTFFTRNKVTKRERWADKVPAMTWADALLYRECLAADPYAPLEEILRAVQKKKGHEVGQVRKGKRGLR